MMTLQPALKTQVHLGSGEVRSKTTVDGTDGTGNATHTHTDYIRSSRELYFMNAELN